MMEAEGDGDDEGDGEGREEPGAEKKFAAEVGAEDYCCEEGEEGGGEGQVGQGVLERVWRGRRHGIGRLCVNDGFETVQVDLEREERVSCSLKSVHFIS